MTSLYTFEGQECNCDDCRQSCQIFNMFNNLCECAFLSRILLTNVSSYKYLIPMFHLQTLVVTDDTTCSLQPVGQEIHACYNFYVDFMQEYVYD